MKTRVIKRSATSKARSSVKQRARDLKAKDPSLEEEFAAVTRSIFDVARRAARGHRYAIGRLAWALATVALQNEDLIAAEILLAVGGALEGPSVSVLRALHKTARKSLLDAQAMGDHPLHTYANTLSVQIKDKTAVGRELVKWLELMREYKFSQGEQIARVIEVLLLGRKRIGLLRGVSEQELSDRVAAAFKEDLSDEADLAATKILHRAGMPSYKAAHNLVNASKNMVDAPSRKRRGPNV